MVDKKITELTELTTPAAADVVAIVDDPAGSPNTKKITYANLEGNLSITASQVSDFDTEVGNNGSVVANTAKTSYPGTADATELNILDGALITTTELNYVSGVSSSIQTQIDAKSPIADPTFTGEIGIGAVNVSETELGILEGAVVSTTELNYTSGVSSSIQTQFDAKLNLTGGVLTGSVVAADHVVGSIAQLINVVYGSGVTPPTASDTTEGALYVQYTP